VSGRTQLAHSAHHAGRWPTARRLDPAREAITAFPPARSSFEIRSLVPAPCVIGQPMLRSSLLPDEVVAPATGQTIKRPANWC
jgi:hypothetical protein